MESCKISGDLGDIIYALPTIKYLGIEVVYLNYQDKYKLSGIGKTKFSEVAAKAIKPLIESQPYIKHVAFYDGQKINYDLDTFRTLQKDLTFQNLAHAIANTFSVDVSVTNQPWIFVEPVRKEKIVLINKTDRYLNRFIDWHSFDNYLPFAAFVGTQSEYENFCLEMEGKIPFYKTENLLELAALIKGCDLFIGNQSSPYAIAEGLKQNTIQVVCPECPNCIFTRPNAEYHGHTVAKRKNFIDI